MKKQSLYVTISIRLAFLIVPLLVIYLLYVFAYNPHKSCEGNVHYHSGGPMGTVIFSFLVAFIWVVAIIFELMWRYFKKDRKVLPLLVFLIVFVVLFAWFVL